MAYAMLTAASPTQDRLGIKKVLRLAFENRDAHDDQSQKIRYSRKALLQLRSLAPQGFVDVE